MSMKYLSLPKKLLFCSLLLLFLLTSLSFSEPKQAIYWRGESIFDHPDGSALTDEAINARIDTLRLRGFTHVMLDSTWKAYFPLFTAKNIDVILYMHFPYGPFNFLFKHPYDLLNRHLYIKNMNKFKSFLINNYENISAVVQGVESSVFPDKEFYAGGSHPLEPDFSLDKINNSDGDYKERSSFRNYPNDNDHFVKKYMLDTIMTMDEVEFNFPELDISSTGLFSNNHIIGPTEETGNHYIICAQTFKPLHSRITCVDLFLVRVINQEIPPDISSPCSDLEIFLTRVDENGRPDLDQILGSSDRINWLTGHSFDRGFVVGEQIQVTDPSDELDSFKVYFDPDSIGFLDIDSQYALVIRSRDRNPLQNPNPWFYLLGCRQDNYSEGQLYSKIELTSEGWMSEPSVDMWFNVYYPNLPSRTDIYQNEENDYIYLGDNESNMRIAQTFLFSSDYDHLSSIILKVKKFNNTTASIKVSIRTMMNNGQPSENELACFRFSTTALEEEVTIDLPCDLQRNTEYAIVLEYEGEPNGTEYYKIASKDIGVNPGPYIDGKLYHGSLSTWTSISTADLYFAVKTPVLNMDLGKLHRDWIEFETQCIAWIIRDIDSVVNEVNKSCNSDIKVYVYSGYQDYIKRNLTNMEYNSMDWSMISATTDIDYAVCAWDLPTELGPTLEALGKNIILIGNVGWHHEYLSYWKNVYNRCEGGLNYFCWNYNSYDSSFKRVPVWLNSSYRTSFENDDNGNFDEGWDGCWRRKISDSLGRVEVYSESQTIHYITLDSKKEINPHFPASENGLRLYCDLSIINQVVMLNFKWWDYNSGNIEDGVYLSDDAGLTFVKVYDFTGPSDRWNLTTLNISQIIENTPKLNKTNSFIIEFRCYSTGPIPTSGLKIDDVNLTLGGSEQLDNITTGTTEFSCCLSDLNSLSGEGTVQYTIGTATDVEINVYNIAGQKVRTLLDAPQNPGEYSIYWDGRDDRGQTLNPGAYFFRMEAQGECVSEKLLIVK
ncbi:hypothetical protein JXL83_05120 [candidate division WOR-3 bacterium]|nr:hypothetical protein [candidate division WOR-3 bacterium]